MLWTDNAQWHNIYYYYNTYDLLTTVPLKAEALTSFKIEVQPVPPHRDLQLECKVVWALQHYTFSLWLSR